MTDHILLHDPDRNRYWFDVDGGEAYVTYRDDNDTRVLDYSFVSPEFRGSGLARELVGAVLDQLIADDRSAHPTCSYIAAVADSEPRWNARFGSARS